MKEGKIAAFYSDSCKIPFETFQEAARRATKDKSWHSRNGVLMVWMSFYGKSLQTLAGYKVGKRWKKMNGAK